MILKDGFYLSAFLHIDELAHLLDVKLRHDQNIALWRKEGNNVSLVCYWEIERITGLKQHSTPFFSIPKTKEFINYLLSEYNLSIDDMVEIWGTPQLDTCNDYHSVNEYPNVAYHSISHLFSSLMLDSKKFYNDCIIGLAVDAGPENVVELDAYKKFYYAGCFVKNGDIEIFPIYSPGRLWSYSKNLFNKREGTLMALAYASTSKVEFEEEDILPLQDINSYMQAKEYIDRLADKVWSITEEDKGKIFNGFDTNFSLEDNRISMVMKEIQKMSNKIMERNVEFILDKYKVDSRDAFLSLSGGYALNCPTNSYLMDKYGFKGFIAPPCVNDCGLSLGIGLYAFYKKASDDKLNVNINHAYYGNKDYNLQNVLDSGLYNLFIKNVTDFNLTKIVKDIKEAPIIWFNEASEIGPRALGNRSLLGDPRGENTKDILNKIKLREWWRPVAPIVMQEYGSDYFENYDLSPYMLRTFKIKNDKLDLIPAVAHLNETARVQTVNCIENSLLYEVLKEFMNDTGIPILCNTSLNDKGEPIINKIEEAFNFALRKGIKVAYVNGKRIEFHNHKKYLSDKPLTRNTGFITLFDDEQRNTLLKECNPNNITKDELTCYYDNYDIMTSIDLNSKSDLRKLSLHTKALIRKYGQIFERD